MRRTVVCLALGSVLWVVWGAVREASHWQVSANAYLVSLVVAGAVLGAVWPAPHLVTGALLAGPGAFAVLAAGPGGQRDFVWWLLTVVVGLFAAAGSHRLMVELRQRFPPRRIRHMRQ
jgi:hypothetical protein